MSLAQPTFETAAALPEIARRNDSAPGPVRPSWLRQFVLAPFKDTDDRVRVRVKAKQH